MVTILFALWPLFALIMLGFYLRRNTFFDVAFWQGAERINYYVLFPALFISSLAVAPLDNPSLPKLSMVLLITLLISCIIFVLFKIIKKTPTNKFGVNVQGALRFNTYLGLAIINDLYGAEGIAVSAVILAILTPVCNIISVIALSDVNELSLKKLLFTIFKNPLIIACLIGFLLNITNIGLPFNSLQLFKLMASASLPLGLLCVGAALQIPAVRYSFYAILTNSAVRLLGMPLLALLVAYYFGLTGLDFQLLVIFFAIPTAPNAYIMAKQLGGDSQLMAGIITFQTLVSILTLPIIISIIA